ncbi:MAG: J domain-containing protein [Thermoplasmatota archaeon]
MKLTSALWMATVILFLTSMVWMPVPGSAEEPPSRAPIFYSGDVDGVGSDGDICLAGHRWYNISFTFLEVNSNTLGSLGASLKVGGVTSPLLTWDMNSTGVVQEQLQGQLSLRRPGFFSDGVNTTFHFDSWFHLSWNFDREITVVPRVWIDSTQQEMDALSELKLDIQGTLMPYDAVVYDENDHQVLPDETNTVRAGSNILVRELKFRYWHLTEDLSSYSPTSSELEPVVVSDTSSWNCTWGPEGFTAGVQVINISKGTFSMKLDLRGIRDEWKVKVKQWDFTLNVDGVAPSISLRHPTSKVGDTTFQWEITVTDLPALSDTMVDGASVSYMVFRNGAWGPWQPLPEAVDGKSINFLGSAVGERGQDMTMLRFRASDVLGNENISQPFPIDINQPPVVSVPEGLDGSIYLDNQSLNLLGYDFVQDPDDDDDDMEYTWYLDEDERPISTLPVFNKTLFNINPGLHTIHLTVNDSFSESEVSFEITVKEAPRDEDRTDIIDILTNQTFLTIAIPVLVMILILIVVVIIIIISKKMRKADDFVINEDATLDTSQASDMAKKIREMYEEAAAAQYSGDEAHLDSDDGKFDFDYNLYEVLGLEKTASDQEIKKAYRKLAAYYHPDRVATHKEIDPHEAAEEMVRINKAKEVLMNADFKEEYDSYISDMDFSMDLNDDDDDMWA